MKMKANYWTKEKCQEVALLCKSRTEFNNKYKGAYVASHKNGWINEICSHIQTDKPNGYWTKEKCQEVALLCIKRMEYRNKYRGSFNVAYKNNWLDDICAHMIYVKPKSKGYWTKEKCQEFSIKCEYKEEFRNRFLSAYDSAYRNNWLDDICSHMKLMGNLFNRLIYIFEFSDRSVYVGLTCNSSSRHNNHMIKSESPVNKYIKKTDMLPIYKELTGYIDIESAMEKEKYYIEYYKKLGYNVLNKSNGGEFGNINYKKWNYENCKTESLKYSNRTEFCQRKREAYNKCSKEGWLNDFYPLKH